MKIQVQEINTPFESYSQQEEIKPSLIDKWFSWSKSSREKYGVKCKAFCACDYCLNDNHVVLFGFDIRLKSEKIKKIIRFLKLNYL